MINILFAHKTALNIIPYYIYCCRACKKDFTYERKIKKQILPTAYINYNLVTVPKYAHLLKAIILTNAFS